MKKFKYKVCKHAPFFQFFVNLAILFLWNFVQILQYLVMKNVDIKHKPSCAVTSRHLLYIKEKHT